MLRIDAHQHFWQYEPVRDSWIDDTMTAIRKDFMPEDLQPLLQQHQLNGCVVVQSDQSEDENTFQLANAAANDFIKGVVGWVDLCSDSVEASLRYYSRFEKMKGFRHILQGEAAEFMLQDNFKHGISLLRQYGFTYDILIYAHQLQHAAQLVAAFPDQMFVIDHIAKPAIRDGETTNWEKGIRAIAKYGNVHCKISGMVTEADWKNWNEQSFKPYMDIIVEVFGVERIMYGSDWPVCLLAADYAANIGIVQQYFSTFSAAEQALFFGGNAAKFYQLI
jgi:L-fuconolactonase